MWVTCTQTLYTFKQDKYPYICNCTCNYNYNYPTNYPLYKYLLKYSPEAYILKSFTLAIKQCKQVFYLSGIGI
jgi:hypothetical protein